MINPQTVGLLALAKAVVDTEEDDGLNGRLNVWIDELVHGDPQVVALVIDDLLTMWVAAARTGRVDIDDVLRSFGAEAARRDRPS